MMEQKTDQTQKVWLQRLEREEKNHEKYRNRARQVEKVFTSGDDSSDPLYVPLYWSVVGVEHVGVYSNQPVPDVRPRNDPQNPTLRQISSLIDRALRFCIDHPSFDNALHRSIDDYLAMGLGVPRVKIDSIIDDTITPVPIMGMVQGPQGPMEAQVGTRQETTTTTGDQTVRWEYVPWRRFGWEPCNEWDHCGWIYFRHRMTQLQIKKRFGKTVKASKDKHDKGDTNSWKQRTFDIYEIWDKDKKEVLFIAKGEHEPIQIIPDPMKLVDFWPCPPPMMCNLPSEEMIPKPDYDYIEHYDAELNRLQERRMHLIEQIKAAGAYDKSLTELSDLLELEDGQMLAIDQLMQRLKAAGGAENAMWFLPLTEKIEALRVCTEQITFVKAQVDEILGISDIVRGVTAASETATAQEIKGRWVGVRLTRKRETVIYTVKSMMRIMSQLLASHISPENLQRMTQMQITEEMMGILQDDMLMQFSIDIESDSTIAKDEFAEKETFQEMLNGVAQFASTVLPLVQQNAFPAGASSAILAAALKPYAKYDRTLEDEMSKLPQTMQQLQQLTQQNQQTQQQLEQTQQQMQQWQAIATQMQQDSTEAATDQKTADAKLKRAQAEKATAETREKYGKTKDGALQPVKTGAEINELRERAESYKHQSTGGQS